jgi:hypothetical protein
MNTAGVMMPMVETNLETVRNPTEFIRGRMSDGFCKPIFYITFSYQINAEPVQLWQ